MKKLMKKKVNVFGKKLPVFVIALFAIGLVSAALLPWFGVITGNVTVSQGLLVDGKSMLDSGNIVETWAPFTSLEEKTFLDAHWLDNQASVEAVVSLVPACLATGSSDGCNDIITSYFELETLEATQNMEKMSQMGQQSSKFNMLVRNGNIRRLSVVYGKVVGQMSQMNLMLQW